MEGSNLTLGLLLTLILSMHTPSHAREDVVPGSRYTSARAAGMADAFFPLADDGATALFYNPASIARAKKPHFEALNLQLSMNSDFLRTVDATAYNVTNLSAYQPTLSASPFAFPGVGSAYLPTVIFPEYGAMPAFAFGILADVSLASEYNSGAYRYRSRYQLIPAAGFAWSLAHGIIRIGYVLQWVNIAKGTVIPTSPSSLSYLDRLNQGSTFAHQLGFSMTLPWQMLPTASLVARNVFNAVYNSSVLLPVATNSVGVPATDLMTLDAAVSITPRIGPNSFLNWVLAYRDILNSSNTLFYTRLTAGVEFEIKKALYLRAGFGSGFPSVGIGFRREKGELQLAWSGEETGVSRFQDRVERRWILQFQARAF